MSTLRIPKQIYFDEPMLQLYTQYAQYEGKPFTAVVRDILAEKVTEVTKEMADQLLIKSNDGLLSLYGSLKSPYRKKFTYKEERRAFIKAAAKNAAEEGQI